MFAVLAKPEAARLINADLSILADLLEEARQIRKLNLRGYASRQERLHQKISSEIISRVSSKIAPESNDNFAKKGTKVNESPPWR